MDELSEMDQQLARDYGSYASYPTAEDPALVDTYGDGPAEEVDRLLDTLTGASSTVLDLGCGAGFTLCRLAPRVKAIWGFEQDARLLAAARLRAQQQGLANARFVAGNASVPEDSAPLPDAAFDVVLSRRGPNVNNLLSKMKPDALVIQELWRDPLALLEIFGRKSFAARLADNANWLVEQYSWLNLFPVSVKDYYFTSYFRDIDHLAAFLSRKNALLSYPMPPLPYDPQRDRAALELYARYNTTPRGIQIINTRKVYLFRRAPVQVMPVDPGIEPQW